MHIEKITAEQARKISSEAKYGTEEILHLVYSVIKSHSKSGLFSADCGFSKENVNEKEFKRAIEDIKNNGYKIETKETDKHYAISIKW